MGGIQPFHSKLFKTKSILLFSKVYYILPCVIINELFQIPSVLLFTQPPTQARTYYLYQSVAESEFQ